MIKFNKRKGFSFYDVVISLVILVIASLYVTKIFVETIEVSKKSNILDVCTYQAIETVENFKGVRDVANINNNAYFSEYEKVIAGDEITLTKNFVLEEETYKENILITKVDSYTNSEIRVAQVYKNSVANDLQYQEYKSSLFKVKVQMFNSSGSVLYDIETMVSENHKVVN